MHLRLGYFHTCISLFFQTVLELVGFFVDDLAAGLDRIHDRRDRLPEHPGISSMRRELNETSAYPEGFLRD